jgi:hypothetical protein
MRAMSRVVIRQVLVIPANAGIHVLFVIVPSVIPASLQLSVIRAKAGIHVAFFIPGER